MTSTDLRENVRLFHEIVIGGELPERPSVPEEGVARHRLRLIAEEFIEVLEASYGGAPGADEAIEHVAGLIELIVAKAPLRVDLVAFAHELTDLEYVCEGAFLGFGIDSRPVHAEIQRVNMTKQNGPVRADGKREKPPGFIPADVASIVASQMENLNGHE